MQQQSSRLRRQRHASSASATDAVQPVNPLIEADVEPCKICTSITAKTIPGFLQEIKEAQATGVDLIELRLDFIEGFSPDTDLKTLMDACTIPYIVTFRPTWEGGNYSGPEPIRLATLKYAALQGAPFVDVEFKAAQLFFAGAGEVPLATRVILSSHNFSETPPAAALAARAAAMWSAGADIVKIATMANDIADAAAVLSLLQDKQGPTIALAMGERGLVTRLLAARYGGFLTFAALDDARASAPGQPTVAQMQRLYNFGSQRASTRVFGIIGSPVHHSKSPLIHNAAFRHIGFDGVYVPLLVDNLERFLTAFQGHNFSGFSVTIPHKEEALRLAAHPDPVCAQIGACNTLVRAAGGDASGGGEAGSSVEGGSSQGGVGPYWGYNTDWLSAISAIERGLASSGEASSSSSGDGGGPGSPLAGRTFVVVGAGGAGRALAFGAAARGARVLVANRNRARAEALAAAVPGGAAAAVDWDALQRGEVEGDVLANTTSVGMVPDVEASPVAAHAVVKFKLVFDAVYTPRDTRLLRDAAAAGVATVDGVAMFVGQAVEQFRLFTRCQQPPVEVMEAALLGAAAPGR